MAVRVPVRRSALASAALAWLLATSALGQAARAPSAATRPGAAPGSSAASQIDRLFAAAVGPDQPAMAVIVVKDGKTLVRKAYGLANVELQVPARPEMVFRIGSVTKQFTATAIMMLVEEGKLALTDEITKVLPGYPAQGRAITIEHLLTHTGGIPNYSESPARNPMKEMTPAEMIELFGTLPIRTAPGEEWRYSNSGYVVLGAVIEKVSGQRWADFMKQRVFDRAGLTRTRYGGTEEIIDGRVAFYSLKDGHLLNADHISMTQPFSAGGLVSTVDDLARWNAALDAGILISKASLARVFTPYTLGNGQSAGYGYGWGMGRYDGCTVYEHGGTVSGARAHVLRIPDRGVYVAVLSNVYNWSPPPADLARKAAAMAMGRPVARPTPIALAPEALDRYVGAFAAPDGMPMEVKRDGERLVLSDLFDDTELKAAKPGEFFVEGDDFSRYRFEIDPATGRAASVTLDNWGPRMVAPRTTPPPMKERTAVAVGIPALDRLVGEYRMRPTFSIVVTREGGRLMARETNRQKVEIFPESETDFFRKDVDAQITFTTDASGAIQGLVLHRGGRRIVMRRVGR